MRDPTVVFNRLFGVDEPASSGSILDLILADAKSLNHQLGRADQQKLSEYM